MVDKNVDKKKAHWFAKTRKAPFLTLAAFAYIIIGFYFSWFYIWHDFELSKDPSVWGAFGDYIGGLLNPIVAMAAFYWLYRSVGIQAKELRDTTEALKGAEKLQRADLITKELYSDLASLEAELAHLRSFYLQVLQGAGGNKDKLLLSMKGTQERAYHILGEAKVEIDIISKKIVEKRKMINDLNKEL